MSVPEYNLLISEQMNAPEYKLLILEQIQKVT